MFKITVLIAFSDSDVRYHRARTFAIATKSNYETNWTAKYKINLKKRIDKDYHLACYYSIPNDNTSDSLLPAQINATLCTHLIVSFAQVQNNSVYFKSSFDTNVRYLIIILFFYNTFIFCSILFNIST